MLIAILALFLSPARSARTTTCSYDDDDDDSLTCTQRPSMYNRKPRPRQCSHDDDDATCLHSHNDNDTKWRCGLNSTHRGDTMQPRIRRPNTSAQPWTPTYTMQPRQPSHAMQPQHQQRNMSALPTGHPHLYATTAQPRAVDEACSHSSNTSAQPSLHLRLLTTQRSHDSNDATLPHSHACTLDH
ncbi:hypothetical protein BU15DRAFT_67430 [Melanogaster broomeanus]|nr:hypothetical protein BU15DRAFT_67430 [Melanogaster broomeanus]